MFSLASPSTSGGSASTGSTSSLKSLTTGKRSTKRVSWNEKKRAGMSFLIVIAFFAVFALIIIVEIVMIDEKSKSAGVTGRHGSYGRQNGEVAPDYEEVRDPEYSVEEAVFLKNSRFIKDLKQVKSEYIYCFAKSSSMSTFRCEHVFCVNICLRYLVVFQFPPETIQHLIFASTGYLNIFSCNFFAISQEMYLKVLTI